MIIIRVPYRVSFFGGGSDYPDWCDEHGGAVLSTTIDKYCYLTVRWLPPFFEHKHRVVWSLIENVNSVGEIQHPAVRECMNYLCVDKGIEIHHDGDLPARAGMGSSSAFTVGLLHGLHLLMNQPVSPEMLAKEAIYIEQEKKKEHVGSQDQVAAAFGGLNVIEFHAKEFGGGFSVSKVNISEDRRKEFESHLMLVFTGFSRNASDIAATYKFNRREVLKLMKEYVTLGQAILTSNRDLADFGKALDYTWDMKKRLSSEVTSPYIDYIYDQAKKAGAIGGKLLGAGGGGFLLLFVEPDKQEALRKSEAMRKLLFVPFHMESKGTEVVLNNGSH